MAKTLRAELEGFLDGPCVRYGFCSVSNEERLRLVTSSSLTAHQFAIAVLEGEGFPDPEAELRWIRTLSNLFVEQFGHSCIAAEEFGAGEEK